MANSSDKSVRSEAIRVSLLLPGVGIPADEDLRGERVDLKHLKLRGIATPVTSLHRAACETSRLLRKYLGMVRKGKLYAVQELLDINPEFIRYPKVQEAWVRYIKLERPRRKQGRRKFSHTIDPIIVAGFVAALRASGQAKTDHQAIRLLGRLGILTYDRARALYRAAKVDPRLSPVLLPPREESETVSADELAELLKNAIEPRPGETLSYALDEDGVFRPVKNPVSE